MSDPTKLVTYVPEEQRVIRANCVHPTGTFLQFRKEETELSIPDRFEKMARMYPNRLASKARDRSLTYEALNQIANRIAHAILAQQAQQNEPIALLFEHGIAVIPAILGVLKTGNFFLPLDPTLPVERITDMLEDCQARFMITNNRNADLTQRLREKSRQILNIDDLNETLSTADPGFKLSADTLSHLLYTSGSTGKPKAVIQNHRNILHEIMAYTNGFHICPHDRMTLLASCASGQGLKNAFCALLNGAALYPLDVKSEGLTGLADQLTREEITAYHSSVSLYRYLLKTLTAEKKFPHLRLIRLASQQVFKEDVELYKKYFSPDCILVNALSSTETGTFCWYFMNNETVIEESAVPVGYPLEDKSIVLLGDNSKAVGPNRVGEIAVKSRYVTPGYWRRPDLTRRKFLVDPDGSDETLYLTGDLGQMTADGALIYTGRKDFRVKIRGYSVEVAEIERELLAHPGVKEAGVVAWDREPGDKYLAAYVVPHRDAKSTIDELHDLLNTKLPDYMVPSAFVFLESLPLTNGKLDRAALPAANYRKPDMSQPSVRAGAAEPAFVSPRTGVEKTVAAVWAEVLELTQVGIHDNFFDLGGHSLKATQVMSRLNGALAIDLPVRFLFDFPTIAALAVRITQRQIETATSEERARLLGELEILADEEQPLLGKKS